MKTLKCNFLGILILAAPVTLQAQFDYTTNADGVTITITGYASTGPDAVIIPPDINGLTVTDIGEFAFSGADITSIMIADTVTDIEYAAFEGSSTLTNVTIPRSVTSIGDYVFSSAGLTSVTIPGSVTNIPEGAFEGCRNLTTVTIPDGTMSIGYGAFGGSGLTTVTIPGSVSEIAESAFSACNNLTNVTISSGVPSVGTNMFGGCPNLLSATIASSVTNLGDGAFGGCSQLTEVFFTGNAPAVDRTVFEDFRMEGEAVVPFYVTTAYYLPGTTGWAEFSSNTFIPTTNIVVPAVLWNPTIQTSGPNFGVQSNQFGFDITGTTNLPVAIEACDDRTLSNWVVLQRLTLTNGLFHFSEPFQTSTPARFYRIGFP